MYDGDKVVEKIEIDWIEVVCKCSYWIKPQLFKYITENNCVDQQGVFFPYSVRNQDDKFQGWKQDENEDVLFHDKNSKPQDAISLLTTGRTYTSAFKNYTCCHIFDKSFTRDWKYFTCVANLVLVPRVLKAFTDHDPKIQECLRCISFKRYDWSPASTSEESSYSQYFELVNELPIDPRYKEKYKETLKGYHKTCEEKGLTPPFQLLNENKTDSEDAKR